MRPTFDPKKLKANKLDFDYEIGMYGHLGSSKWLKSQRSAFHTQFSGESRKAPDDQVLKSIGYLIWACSLYETKISRANFWLNCYIQDRIIELPGQAVSRSKLIATFTHFYNGEITPNWTIVSLLFRASLLTHA